MALDGLQAVAGDLDVTSQAPEHGDGHELVDLVVLDH